MTDQPVPAATRVWTVKYSNYEPAEVDSTWATQAEAEAEAERLNDKPGSTGMWEVGSFSVQGIAPAPTAPAGLRSVVDITGIDAIRAAVIREMEDEGVVIWGDEGHRARFLAIATPEPVEGEPT